MSDYVPSVADVKSAYVAAHQSDDYGGINSTITRAEFDRFIAKVKADALKSATDEWRKHLLATSSSYVCAESWLKNRAARIEEEK